jgi:hypothetical protein
MSELGPAQCTKKLKAGGGSERHGIYISRFYKRRKYHNIVDFPVFAPMTGKIRSISLCTGEHPLDFGRVQASEYTHSSRAISAYTPEPRFPQIPFCVYLFSLGPGNICKQLRLVFVQSLIMTKRCTVLGPYCKETVLKGQFDEIFQLNFSL